MPKKSEQRKSSGAEQESETIEALPNFHLLPDLEDGVDELGHIMRRKQMEEREKRYVPVIVRFEADGKLRPLEIEFDEAHRYPVDKILDVRRAACQSVGGVGDRYTCRIQGKESYLWFEKGRWFVAAKR